MRGIMLPAFSTPQIAALTPIFERTAAELLKKWKAACLERAKPGTFAQFEPLEIRTDILFCSLNSVGEGPFSD